MATLKDFQLQVKEETGKKINDPAVIVEAKKRLAAYDAGLKKNQKK